MKKFLAVLFLTFACLTAVPATAQREIPLPDSWFLVIDARTDIVPDPLTIVPREPLGFAFGANEREVVRRLRNLGVTPAPNHVYIALQWPYDRTPELPELNHP